MSPIRRYAAQLGCALFASLLGPTMSDAGAQTPYPTKAVRLVLGFPPGTNVDLLARPIATRMSEAFAHPVIVDNRAGATGLIANEFVAKAPPDGYTLLVAPGSSITSTPHLKLKMPYDSLRDLAPTIQISAFPNVLIVNPVVPAKTVKDLVAIARSKPGMLTFGSSGVGSAFHLSGELFKTLAKVDMLHVPYKGGNLALNDLIGGRIDLIFYTLAVASPHINAGKVRAIAVTSLTRDPTQPNLPTVDEAGLKGYEIVGWHGFFAPAGTPREIVDRVNGLVAKILTTREMRELWTAQGMQVVPNTPEQFARRIQSDYEKYGRVVKAVGIQPE